MRDHTGTVGTRTATRRTWSRRLVSMAAAMAALAVPVGLAASPGVASATPAATTCTGTPGSPGTLAGGTYASVTVTGVCQADAGQVVVTGDLSVAPGAALVAAFAHNASGPGTSGVTVDGNVTVGSGATMLLGCLPNYFPCIDDPGGTLSSADTIKGSLDATDAFGVVVHNTTVGGDVVQTGGGGGLSCNPTGIFAAFNSPVYSDYEDNTIGGNIRLTGLTSCWLGAIRDNVGGSATFADNKMADPDASENLSNHIAGNLLCSGNSPVVQYGDSGDAANVVGGFATGECAFAVRQPDPAPSGPPTPISVPVSSPAGYWLVAADGGIFSFGVPFLGSEAGTSLAQPIAGMAAVPGGSSYNLADANGTVFGNGPRATDCAGLSGPLNKPIVAIASAPGGNGCWLAGGDGGVFAFGSNAPFFGSAGSLSLVQPIVGMAAAPNNDGYDLAAADGGVFTYGPGTTFYGSMGGQRLNKAIVGMAVDPSTGGYWLVASDGGVFSFNAPFFGSLGSTPLNKPIVGIEAAPTGDGYYLVAADGGVFAFGKGAHFQGSTGSLHLNQPVVGMSLG